MQAKVRYRILFLTSLPILLTLISLVFITIYWNVIYTGKQLFMKVKADLVVANSTLVQVQERQQDRLDSISASWDFQHAFRLLKHTEQQPNPNAINALNILLAQQQQTSGLDFLRLISVADAAADPDLRMMLHQTQQKAFSGFMVLSAKRLERINASLATQAQITLVPTSHAKQPQQNIETRGLLSRTLLPIADLSGNVFWYLDGGMLFNRNTAIVDNIRDLVYGKGTLPERSIGTVTLFLDNIRISTNVPLEQFPKDRSKSNRALGTLVSDEVYQQVLVEGQTWINRAFVLNDWYISGYLPLRDVRGKRIGMVYAGFSESPFLHNYLLNIIELGTILVFVLLISGFLVYRGANSLLQPIEYIHQVVTAVQSGRNIRIGKLDINGDNELAHLAEQFDNMLDLLQRRNAQIQAAAEQLEIKVEQRTRSLQDKTEELERNVALLHATRQQLVTNEKLTALGELIAGIAHEINNPTAVILGNMELLKYELGDNAAVVEEEIELVIQQVGRITTIIRSLLQYSRPGEFNAPITLQPVTQIVEEMLLLARHSIEQQEVTLIKEFTATGSVEVNRPQLLQVLINLMVNAAHAIENKGRIWLRTYDWLEDGKAIGVKIEVEDEGMGITKEDLSRIFDPFYTTRKDGTGLGLSLSYGIIKRLGGTIEVSSTVGKGTIFTIGLYHKAKDDQQLGPYEGLHFGDRIQ
ncbi:HAMP domain-containing sensor histidine kinase [Shewanella livingstonensis]|uniref:histidine kinase n=1 Tax=Shewanella livingstonensis TaxID=150120 RepID=A0A3G8M138_9GAMM|nr:HAMP domain-containing sensor histidine kinase [Shewanella livingstonensis]AZG75055.1 HAMP domain-containing protein [Shewanella livingstonensis]